MLEQREYKMDRFPALKEGAFVRSLTAQEDVRLSSASLDIRSQKGCGDEQVNNALVPSRRLVSPRIRRHFWRRTVTPRRRSCPSQ